MSHCVLHQTAPDGTVTILGPFPSPEVALGWAGQQAVEGGELTWAVHELVVPLTPEGETALPGSELTFTSNEAMLTELGRRFAASCFVANKEVGDDKSHGLLWATGPDPYVLGLLDTAASAIKASLLESLLGAREDPGIDLEDL